MSQDDSSYIERVRMNCGVHVLQQTHAFVRLIERFLGGGGAKPYFNLNLYLRI